MKIIMSKYLSGISPITVCCLNINKLENKCDVAWNKKDIMLNISPLFQFFIFMFKFRSSCFYIVFFIK